MFIYYVGIYMYVSVDEGVWGIVWWLDRLVDDVKARRRSVAERPSVGQGARSVCMYVCMYVYYHI